MHCSSAWYILASYADPVQVQNTYKKYASILHSPFSMHVAQWRQRAEGCALLYTAHRINEYVILNLRRWQHVSKTYIHDNNENAISGYIVTACTRIIRSALRYISPASRGGIETMKHACAKQCRADASRCCFLRENILFFFCMLHVYCLSDLLNGFLFIICPYAHLFKSSNFNTPTEYTLRVENL